MKRRLWLNILLLLTLTSGGCTGGMLRPTPETRIVVLWHPFSGAEGRALQDLADQFNQTHRDLTLIVEYQEQIFSKVTAAAPEQRPDLVVIEPDRVPQYHEAGIVVPLAASTPALRDALDDVLPMGQALYTVDGTLEAVPLGLATYVLYYNDAWARDLGYRAETATTLEFRDVVCRATDLQGGQVGLGFSTQPGIFLAVLAAGGAAMTDEAGRFRFNDSAGFNAASLIHDLLNAACARYSDVPGESLEQFSNSTMTFLLESSQRYVDVEAAVFETSNFMLNVNALPGPNGPGPNLWYGPGVLLLAPEGSRRDAAETALAWLLEPEAQLAWERATHYLPVRRSLIAARLEDSELNATEAQLLRLALEAVESARWYPLPRQVEVSACRAGLVRGLIELGSQRKVADVLADTQSACTMEVQP